MTDKQELRAKALELAILLQGPVNYDPRFPSQDFKIQNRHLNQAKEIEKYILEADQG
jgi:hypothetical protein